MSLKSDLEKEVTDIFKDVWTTRKGQKVPDSEDLGLGNDAVELQATVLYADMSDSTDLVDNQGPKFAAEVYKAYLRCAARVIKSEGGRITAYDGDRIMAVFIGDTKNTTAVRAALKINYAVQMIVNPLLKKQYPKSTHEVKHVVGIDTSDLFIARIGVRNDNDLVWVGRAANYAAKLSSLNGQYRTYITKTVFDVMHDTAKYDGNPKQLMWTACLWTAKNNMPIYGSTWRWPIN